jgi:hypothetical protein
MKKLKLSFLAIAFALCTFSINCMASGHSVMLTILHPDQWGLDSAISSVITAAVVFLIGLFSKKPTRKK